MLSLISMPAAQAASPNGSYSGPIEMRSGPHPGQLVLERIDVSEQQATVQLRLVNTMPQKMLMTCPAAGVDEEIRIIRPEGEDVRPARSYCTERAGMTWAVNVGTALPLTVTFPAQGWEDGTFGLYWYGYSAGAMQLRAGQIVAVAPPPGSRLGDLRGPWDKLRDQVGRAGLLLVLVLLVMLAAWLRRWYVRAGVEGDDESALPVPPLGPSSDLTQNGDRYRGVVRYPEPERSAPRTREPDRHREAVRYPEPDRSADRTREPDRSARIWQADRYRAHDGYPEDDREDDQEDGRDQEYGRDQGYGREYGRDQDYDRDQEDDRDLEAGQAWQTRHRPRSTDADSESGATGANVIGFPPRGRRRRDDRR